MDKVSYEKLKKECIEKVLKNFDEDDSDFVLEMTKTLNTLHDNLTTGMDDESIIEHFQMQELLADKLPNLYKDDDEIEVWKIWEEEFVKLKEITIRGTRYVFLVNTEDSKDFLVRKCITEGEDTYLQTLDSDTEYELVLAYFQKGILE